MRSRKNWKMRSREHYETMMGVPRGRLAVTMDLVTDAMAVWDNRRLLPKPALARPPGDGHSDDHEKSHRRERVDPERDGGLKSKTGEQSPVISSR